MARVLYDPADPAKAMIDQGRWNVVVPFLPGAAGVVLGALGLLALYKQGFAPKPSQREFNRIPDPTSPWTRRPDLDTEPGLERSSFVLRAGSRAQMGP